MKQFIRRFTALFLAMAMVMSFSALAYAVEEDNSGDLSTALTAQESEAVLDAEDLYEDASEQSVAEQQISAGDTDDAQPSDVPVENEAETSDADRSDTADEAQKVQVQDADTGWSKASDGFSLSYYNDSSIEQAKSGLYSVPELTLQAADGTYSFAAGVYEFDDGGKLVAGAYSTDQSPASVTVLTLRSDALTKKLSDTLAVSFTGETKVSGTTITPGAALVSGTVDGVLYFNGAVFTGYYRASKSDVVYAVKDGVSLVYSGPMVEKDGMSTFADAGVDTVPDGLWYYKGNVYTGFLRSSDAENPELLYGVKKGTAELFGGCMNKKAFSSYISNNAEAGQTEYELLNQYDEKWYVEGVSFTGWYENPKTKVVYLLNDGDIVTNYKGVKSFIGMMEEMDIGGVHYVKFARNNQVQDELTGLYYQGGVPLTGVPSVKPTNDIFPKDAHLMHLYKNGKIQDVDDGWYRAPRSSKEFYQPYVYYYFKDNEAISDEENVKLKAIQQGKYKDSSSYYYTFTVTGTLVTNMYKYLSQKNPSALKAGKYRIYCDHTNYTGTILMYNSKTKDYDIPFKSFVISMSKSKANSSSPTSFGTKYGDYALASGYRSWYKFKSRTTGKITMFSKSNHIWGSGSMFHGAAHKFEPSKVKGNDRYMRMESSSYNRFGTAQTQHCVRVQMINMYLISKLYSNSSHFTNNGRSCAKKVRVYLSRNNSKKHMPFGQMTLLNNQDLNGYVLQEANAYGTGKDRSFEPTDYHTAGKTIYLSTKKTSDKSDCVKAKMTGYSTTGYSIEFGNA